MLATSPITSWTTGSNWSQPVLSGHHSTTGPSTRSTFTYLLRYVADPQATLNELARLVKPGGAVASLEFLLPRSRFWRFWWWLYTRLVLPAGGWLTGGREWFEVGRFLGPNISAHYRRYPVEWTVEAWERAGFVDVGVRRMSLGGGLVMWGRRAGA